MASCRSYETSLETEMVIRSPKVTCDDWNITAWNRFGNPRSSAGGTQSGEMIRRKELVHGNSKWPTKMRTSIGADVGVWLGNYSDHDSTSPFRPSPRGLGPCSKLSNINNHRWWSPFSINYPNMSSSNNNSYVPSRSAQLLL